MLSTSRARGRRRRWQPTDLAAYPSRHRGDSGATPSANEENNGRRAFAALSQSATRAGASRGRAARDMDVQRHHGGLTTASSSGAADSAEADDPSRNVRIQVYEEAEAKHAPGSVLDAPSFGDGAVAPLPTLRQRQRENTKEVEGSVPQLAARNQEPPKAVKRRREHSSSRAGKAKHSRRSGPSKRRQELHYDAAALRGPDGRELSFEEVRHCMCACKCSALTSRSPSHSCGHALPPHVRQPPLSRHPSRLAPVPPPLSKCWKTPRRLLTLGR